MNTELLPERVESVQEGKEEKGGFLRVFLITFAIALLIRFFIAQPFIVNGQSMEPTFDNGDYLIIDEISYRLNEPERGDVVVFRFPQDPSKFFIKRIIGLPGEKINIRDNTIEVTQKDGEKIVLEENYLVPTEITASAAEETLDENEYYVLGDNREVSSDSRRWGPVPERYMIGRVLVRFLPINEAGLFPGKVTDSK